MTNKLNQYECCSVIIDTWIESVAQSRTNINPRNIPWDMIRTLVTEMYGGKIDDEEDFQILTSLVNNFLRPAAFDDEFDIVKAIQPAPESGSGEAVVASEKLILPSGIGWKDFMDWVNNLPEREPPTYLGLPANAEKLLLVGQAKEMMEKLSLILGILDEGERVMAEPVVEG
jgi:dynein heavy chain 1